MDHNLLPDVDPVQIREAVLDHEADLRVLERSLHPCGHYETRCVLREAADKLMEAARALAAERPAARPVLRPVATVAN